MSDITNYENLANAIILQAAKDYRKALKCLRANPDNYAAGKDKAEIERFFCSRWFDVLSGVDGRGLMRALQKEATA